ncbi:helicase SNF2 [Vibrio splendidus]|uniref:DEAD/DEAH box helicase n=1 Tax=Vibrio splendidus TaxID=29497 RepID=UPI000D3C534E|nr:SNF2-related protein [Vibrio splendidus]PTP08505.1 helicase SNF2 [Vibrio splendidus]PTP21834.1 helicase SNF2 [Vibrio splendidus]
MSDYDINLKDGSTVRHQRFGIGEVQLVRGDTALVRFEGGFEERPISELELVKTAIEVVSEGAPDNLREVIARCQALAIRSINDSWGVFSTSRINLLPHQLWVCHKTLRKWPVNKLIADDVGLGKTVEAGLILWPLIAKKRVRRILILTPASLAPQWQERLRIMFDIRLTMYSGELDTERSDYWNTHDFVVASLPTLRKDINGRHERMLKAEDWDLLIVDEAHHLNAQEDSGATLGYRFVQSLIEHNKFQSKLFFTATPHRGKDYGFFALLKLLRPDYFDPKKKAHLQQEYVKNVVIRNNKQSVTDMDGNTLFKPVNVSSKTYFYSPEEQAFYDKLTNFILTGQAYASSLAKVDQRAVQLVLIAMQKLAASSVSAIHSAISRRIHRLGDSKQRLEAIGQELISLGEDLEAPELDDRYVELEAEYVSTSVKVSLMENELPMLEELQELSAKVQSETKISTLIELLDDEFKDRTVVFFTEYKSTQALIINTLNSKFGFGCSSFINGDGRLDNVLNERGDIYTWSLDRYDAASQFKEGKVRFIVCTEAGGEGIDLQDNCFSMIHVDLPWNPMRLHQRVGRLNRYGQQHGVEVYTLRNPETVESRIWSLLNSKIESVMRSLGSAMDEPEDLLQLILGMTNKGFFNQLFSEGVAQNSGQLRQWFDAKSGTFGGESAVKVVKDLVGNADKFEYQNLDEVPKLDLINMQQFFESMLKLNGHLLENKDGLMSFKTPSAWRSQYGIKRRYDRLTFDRSIKDQSVDVLGVGHMIFNKAIAEAEEFEGSVAVAKGIEEPLLVYTVKDLITGDDGNQSFTAIAVTGAEDLRILSDEALMLHLIELYDHMPKTAREICWDTSYVFDADEEIFRYDSYLEQQLALMSLPYEKPTFTLTALLLPFVD